jgi:outer membrane protein assembly factor BamA
MTKKSIWITLVSLTTVLLLQSSFAQQADFESGFILESIKCVGNRTISCDFISSNLVLKPGQRIIDSEVTSARLRLFSLSQFKSVDMHLEKGSAKGKVVLVVEVVESSALITEVGTGIRAITQKASDSGNDEAQTLETVSGRLGYQNLFNRQKIVELTVNGSRSELDNYLLNTASGSITYVDPNILGSRRFFGSIDYSHYQYRLQPDTGSSYQAGGGFASTTNADVLTVSAGVRLWKYSYGFAGYQRGKEDVSSSYSFNGVVTPVHFSGNVDTKYVGIGWDSEDDPYFPTRGIVATAALSSYTSSLPEDQNENSWWVAARGNYMLGDRSVFTLEVGGDPVGIADRIRPINSSIGDSTLVLRYSYLFARGDTLAKDHRRAWYVQLGTGPVELSKGGQIGGHPEHLVLTGGLRFETKWIGMIDLYVAAGRSWPR